MVLVAALPGSPHAAGVQHAVRGMLADQASGVDPAVAGPAFAVPAARGARGATSYRCAGRSRKRPARMRIAARRLGNVPPRLSARASGGKGIEGEFRAPGRSAKSRSSRRGGRAGAGPAAGTAAMEAGTSRSNHHSRNHHRTNREGLRKCAAHPSRHRDGSCEASVASNNLPAQDAQETDKLDHRCAWLPDPVRTTSSL